MVISGWLHVSTSSLSNSLEQLEFLPIDARIDHRNQDAFNQTPQTRAGVHRRGNLDMRLLSLLERSHPEGRGDMLRGVDILLDQHPAWFWLAHPLIKGLLHSQNAHFEAVNGACAIASLLDLQIKKLFG
jgi:hypothetical protein